MANIKNFGLVGVGSDVQFGKSGPRLINASGSFEFRTAANGFAHLKAESLTAESLKDAADQIVKVDAAGKLVLGGALADLATDAEIAAAISTEVTNRNTAISTAISTEVTDRNTAITNALTPVQSEIDAIEAAVGLGATGSYTTFTGSNYMNATSTIAGALTALDTQAKSLADNKLALAGGTMTGALILNADPVVALGAVTKQYVDGKISALGNAFEYVGSVAGGLTGSGLDMDLQSTKHAGAYYKVATAGYFKVGAGAEFYANVGDGLVFNNTGGVDVVDNTNSQVLGTTNFITVTGSSDTGFTVDVASTFKGRVDTLESSGSALQTEVNATQTSLGTAVAANGTFAGFSGTTYLNAASSMTDADKKLDIALGALATTVSNMSLSFTLAGDTGTDTFSTAETLTFAGSADIGTAVTNGQVAFSLKDVAGLTAVATAKIQKITVDAKGRIQTSADVTTSDLNEGTNLYFTDARARDAISTSGTGISYNAGTGVISSNATNASTASTIVARDATGGFSAGDVTVAGLTVDDLTMGRVVLAGLDGVLVDDADLTFSVETNTLNVKNVVVATKITVPAPVDGSDATTKTYVDAAVVAGAANAARAIYATFNNGTATIGAIVGRVHRIKVFVDTAASDSVSIQVGTDAVNGELAATAEVDSGATGMYIVEMNQNYATSTTLKVFATNGAVGAVLVEYL